VLLGVEHTREQCPSLRDEEAARFEKEMDAEAVERTANGAGVFGDTVGGVEVGAAVLDAEAAAGVKVLDVDAVAAEVFDECAHARHGLSEGRSVADLRADMHADSGG